MADRYLPIKIVQKREKDASLTEAGGGESPAWLDKVNLEERSEMVNETLNEISKKLEARIPRLSFIPATLELTLDSKATAKTYRSGIRNIVDVNYKNNIIALKDDDTLIVKIENIEDLNRIRKNITNFKKTKDGLASIVESASFKPRINVEEKELLKIKLINYQDADINKGVHNAFLESCDELGLDVHSTNYTSDLIIYQIPYEEKSFAALQEFEALSSIEDMLSFNSMAITELADAIDNLPLRTLDPEVAYPTVGVIDTGVSNNEHMLPWIEDEFSPYIEADKDTNHGSAVASILIYGDDLQGETYTNSPGCKIYDACVLPKDELRSSITEADLIQHIREAIENRPDINIWNMSIGWGVEADPSKMSDFGAVLDDLADEHNLLICTSVGNCPNFKSRVPPGKIQISSDSVRAISVGSIAHVKENFDQSEINEPSPFSRKGPGPFNIVKPELTHYGGNAGIDEQRRLIVSGVNAINSDGMPTTKVGTSFSTPRVTSILSGLESEIDETFDPLLFKALTIHSAKYPEIEMEQDERTNKMGYGIPSNVKDILYNSENEITLVVRDTIEKGNFIEILDLPFPKEMVEDGFYYGEVIITLVSSPDLDRTQGEEYCQSNLDVFFGTYNEKVDRNGKTARNPIGRDTGTKNLLAPSLYSKRSIKENESFRGERILKSYYQKYQPIKKWAINLSEMSDANKHRYLEYPKLWYIKIEGLFRDHIEKTKGEVNTDFCLIITIRDPKEQHEVYNTVSQELEQNNFVQQDIKVKTRIQLRT